MNHSRAKEIYVSDEMWSVGPGIIIPALIFEAFALYGIISAWKILGDYDQVGNAGNSFFNRDVRYDSITYTGAGNVPNEEDLVRSEKCTICLGEIYNGESLKTLQCMHKFHSSCIDRWLVQNEICPLCRTFQR
jgi:hypothetical protein